MNNDCGTFMKSLATLNSKDFVANTVTGIYVM